MSINIYKKPTDTDTTIHYLSNHLLEQKMAAFSYYINRLIKLPITQERKEIEWVTIQKTAKNNGFPINMIEKLKEKLIHQRLESKNKEPTNHKWIPFTYFSPAVKKSQTYLRTLT